MAKEEDKLQAERSRVRWEADRIARQAHAEKVRRRLNDMQDHLNAIRLSMYDPLTTTKH